MFTLTIIQTLQEWLHEWLGDTAQGRLIANAVMVAVTAILFWILYVIVFRIFNRISNRLLKEDSQIRAFRIQKQEILSAKEMAAIVHRTLQAISWLFRADIVLSFLNVVLGLFDWTHSLAESIADNVRSAVGGIWGSFVAYLPDLFTALVIIGASYLFIKLIKMIFEGVARRRITMPGFYPEWAKTSFNLARLLIIALTVVVVFPYLPGSESPAFQGVSIFFGVLLSLGSTTAVANVVAGIVITYTRAFRKGDFVEIAGTEGKIIERTAFVTRIRTAKNVDVSLPNASVMSGKVINYSSQARRSGIRLHTSITIGYDVPWPKVQELLLSAAQATEHIEQEPTPFVLQTALDDNYVAYELNATTKRVSLRPQIYSELHANILDAFHTAGVEITSPHDRAVRDGNEAAIAPVIARSKDESGED